MVKVSIVIPTFNNTKENLERIINSFDKQTMNQKDFEVIFIDDGSNDFQSFKRLKEITKSKKNYVVRRISPSGWASRPRNIGTKIAKGEYVFYCDDDDTIFPQALERMYNFAKKNDLDVVNPKVIRTKGWSWGWNEYKVTMIGAQKYGIQSMGPMTVPKLYRKRFLIENDIFFPEGEKVWWEDVMFSCLVYSKNPNIGILTDYPIYHWRDQNRSASFGKDLEYKWSQLTNLALFFEKNLSEDDKDIMIGHWYKSRVLGTVRKNFHKKKERTQNIEFENAVKWRSRFVNKNIIKNLDSNDKVLDKILELNKQELAYSLSKSKTGITARSYLKDIRFKGDYIVISCSTTLTYDEREKMKYKGKPTQVKQMLPKDVKNEIPKELHYFDDAELDKNIYSPLIKGRYSRVTWDVKDIEKSEFKYKRSFLSFEVSGVLTFCVKLEDYILDTEDKYQPWDIATRFSFLDSFSQRAIACIDDFKKAAIINGNTYVLYKNNSDLLSIDLNSSILDFFTVAKLNVQKRINTESHIILPIENTYVFGESENEILASIYNDKVDDFIETIATIRTKDNHAYLEIENNNNLKGNCTVHLAIGKKSHELNIQI